MFRKSLRVNRRWDPSREPFYVPALARKFRPDFSFSEQNSEQELHDRAVKGNGTRVQFESEIGQRRYAFCLRALDEQRKENPELVELVITSVLRATDCDVARTVHRAKKYFDFYVDLFGKLSHKQSLTGDQDLRESLESGALQVFENCDEKGRGLACVVFRRITQQRGHTESAGVRLLRVMNYALIRTLRNYPTTQKNGFIIVADMGGLSFENYSFTISRTNMYVASRFFPCKFHKICFLRPLYFLKFVLPALKSFAFPGPMAENVHILTQDPKDLLREPLNLRPEILPPMYGGTNTSFDFAARVRGWQLEEEETECHDMGSTSRGENSINKTEEEEECKENDGGDDGDEAMNVEIANANVNPT